VELGLPSGVRGGVNWVVTLWGLLGGIWGGVYLLELWLI
jgi:hypothetical protein